MSKRERLKQGFGTCLRGLIIAVIAVAAGASSFTHVHDWSVDNGQLDWIGWANATGLELLQIAAALEIRDRRKAKAKAGFPVLVMFAAIMVSLFIQVAEAAGIPVHPVSKILAAALPLLIFLGLFKMLLGRASAQTVPVAGSFPAPQPEPSRPVADHVPTPHRVQWDSDPVAAPVVPQSVPVEREPVREPAPETAPEIPLSSWRVPAQTETEPETVGAELVPAGLTKTEQMHAYWREQRATGRTPSGAELDREVGTKDLGRRKRREWLEAEEAAAVTPGQDDSEATVDGAVRGGELVAV